MKRLRHYNQGTAIVLSCFGSVIEQQRYEDLAARVRETYPDTHVRVATSSKMVIKKLARKDNQCFSLPQVLADLDTQGYERILVVSVYLFPTDEHRYLTSIVDGFKQFSLARIEQTPAIMHHSQLATRLISALHERFMPREHFNVFIHHGAPMLDNPGHQAIHYSADFLSSLSERNFACSLEGAWPFQLLKDEMLRRIKALHTGGGKPVLNLVPLLLVSGNHFINDLNEIKEALSQDADVKIAEPVQGDKFCMLDMPELLDVLDRQIKEGLIRLNAPEGVL